MRLRKKHLAITGLALLSLGTQSCSQPSDASISVKSAMANEVAAMCDLDKAYLGAHFEIISEEGVKRMSVWRRGNEVVHEFHNTAITEIWFKMKNGAVRPVRYFDDYKRGIEYQDADLRDLGKQVNWDALYHLVAEDQVKSGQHLSDTGEGCNQMSTYLVQDGNREVKTEWLELIGFPQSQHIRVGDKFVQLKLINKITRKEKIDAVFAKREAYQTTDFADIGDNESDPFLMKMINLGFVEHGSSGFYNAQGNALDGHHNHNH